MSKSSVERSRPYAQQRAETAASPNTWRGRRPTAENPTEPSSTGDGLEGYAAGLEDNAGSWEALRREFATTARHQGVDPQDAVLLHCLLAPAPFRIRFARALLVNSAPAARAGFFNTLVLDGGPPEFAQAWAETVDMPWPLFPVTPDFSELNGRLLRDWGAEVEGVTGAGPKKRTHPAVFAPSRAPEGLLNLVRGAGYAPVADGRADLSEVEAAFNAMAAEIGNLKAQVAELSRRGGGSLVAQVSVLSE